jgi:hypothetical protein
MNQSHVSDEELKSYLLGNLPQSARALLEEHYLADDEIYERLLAIEEELIDQHVQGLLSSRQWEPLKRSLLLAEDGPERLRFAQALAHLHSPGRQSFPTRLAGGLRQWTKRKALIPVAIGATVLLAFLTVLPESTRRQLINSDNSHTDRPLPRAESHMDGVPSSTVTLSLRSISRDPSASNILRISRGQDRVRLEAELPGDERESYRITVRRVEGGQIQTSSDVRKRPLKSGAVLISAGFSSDSFQEGDYIFTVFAATQTHASEEIMAYTFTVVRTPPS